MSPSATPGVLIGGCSALGRSSAGCVHSDDRDLFVISGASMWTESGGWIVKSAARSSAGSASVLSPIWACILFLVPGTGRGIGDGETRKLGRVARKFGAG